MLSQARLELSLEPGLPFPFLLLEMRDLAPDRVQQRPALAELALHRRTCGRALGDDVLLLRVRLPELLLAALYLRPEMDNLA